MCPCHNSSMVVWFTRPFFSRRIGSHLEKMQGELAHSKQFMLQNLCHRCPLRDQTETEVLSSQRISLLRCQLRTKMNCSLEITDLQTRAESCPVSRARPWSPNSNNSTPTIRCNLNSKIWFLKSPVKIQNYILARTLLKHQLELLKLELLSDPTWFAALETTRRNWEQPWKVENKRHQM